MKLRAKIALAMSAVVAASLGAQILVADRGVAEEFLLLEDAQARRNVGRCRAALERELAELSRTTHDWSAWDETYGFLSGRNDLYVQHNLSDANFRNLGLDLFAFYGGDGGVVWGHAWDAEQGVRLPLPAAFGPSLPDGHRLRAHPDETSAVTGLLLVDGRPFLIASRPIVRSDGSGPIRGTLVMGKRLSPTMLARLGQQVGIEFHLAPIAAVPDDAHRAAGARAALGETVVRLDDEERLSAFTGFPDLDGRPAFLVHAELPREVWAKGREATRFAVVSVAGVSLGLLLVALVLLDRLVLRPLARLSESVVTVARTADLRTSVALPRRDELGTLSNEFQKMMAELEVAQRRLAEAAYASGRAEMAIGALHNIGNGLAPLVAGLDVLRGGLAALRGGNLPRALDKLEADGLDEKGRADLVAYVHRGARRALGLVAEWEEHVAGLSRQTAHVEAILRAQERFRAAAPVVEEVELAALARDAVTLVSDSLKEGATIEVDPRLEALPPVSGERVRLLQVFTNLVTNALESLRRSDTAPRRLSVSGELDAERVRLRFEDNGVGFDEDTRARLFESGFTTKGAVGHGIGLHWCATTIASMGGGMRADSPGAGQGASFLLELPVLTRREGMRA